MDLTLQLYGMIDSLRDEEKVLLIEIAKRFLDYNDWADDELTQEDLHDIAVAEQELLRGEATQRQRKNPVS